MKNYRVVIKTGGMKNAGTDANVYITLIGRRGNSGERLLDKPENDFERHSAGVYKISTSSSLGNIRRIRIRHDNAGKKPGWFLDYITVQEQGKNKLWYFPCSQWLAVDEDDGSIDRTLYAR